MGDSHAVRAKYMFTVTHKILKLPHNTIFLWIRRHLYGCSFAIALAADTIVFWLPRVSLNNILPSHVFFFLCVSGVIVFSLLRIEYIWPMPAARKKKYAPQIQLYFDYHAWGLIIYYRRMYFFFLCVSGMIVFWLPRMSLYIYGRHNFFFFPATSYA